MHSSTLTTLVLISVVAVIVPILVDIPKRVRVPAVVIELLFGILIGPAALSWASRGEIVDVLAEFGLAYLIFLAGFEINFAQLKGRPLKLASATWVASLVLGLAGGFLLVQTGLVRSTVIVGLALTTTALGTMLPILRDTDELGTELGRHVLANGAVGEFAPVVAVAVVLGTDGPTRSLLTLVIFALLAAVAVLLAHRRPPDRWARLVEQTLTTSGQLPVRIALLAITALVWAAAGLGLDILLGAFTAGIVFRTFCTTTHDQIHLHVIESKLDAVGFGFLIPLFFIVSGMKFDLHALLHDDGALAKLPIFLGLFLVTRGLPVMVIYRKELDDRTRRSVALLTSAGLPLIVVITTIGVDTDRMRPANAAALVGAGMLSVLIFPMLGLGLNKLSDPVAEEPSTSTA